MSGLVLWGSVFSPSLAFSLLPLSPLSLPTLLQYFSVAGNWALPDAVTSVLLIKPIIVTGNKGGRTVIADRWAPTHLVRSGNGHSLASICILRKYFLLLIIGNVYPAAMETVEREKWARVRMLDDECLFVFLKSGKSGGDHDWMGLDKASTLLSSVHWDAMRMLEKSINSGSSCI